MLLIVSFTTLETASTVHPYLTATIRRFSNFRATAWQSRRGSIWFQALNGTQASERCITRVSQAEREGWPWQKDFSVLMSYCIDILFYYTEYCFWNSCGALGVRHRSGFLGVRCVSFLAALALVLLPTPITTISYHGPSQPNTGTRHVWIICCTSRRWRGYQIYPPCSRT